MNYDVYTKAVLVTRQKLGRAALSHIDPTELTVTMLDPYTQEVLAQFKALGQITGNKPWITKRTIKS